MEESSSSSSSSAMGFGGGLPVVASRGRGRGRPPKVASASTTPPTVGVDTNSGAAAAAAAASSTPLPLPLPVDGTEVDAGSPNECRRSSRKKIIKFDVRDLLNKNRKAHKIQIEARIDSNPNSNPSTAVSPGSTPVAGGNSNRLFSMFESNHQALPPPPPPPPHALEIFAKPRPTQSLIVAQVTSEPSAVQTVADLPMVAVRKRGRPRKSAPAIVTTVAPAAPSCSDSDTNSNSATTSTSTGSGSGSGGEAAVGANSSFIKRKSKLRVTVKRLNLARRLESSDSGDTPLNITVVGACTSPPSSSSSVGDALVLQDENALDEKPEKQQHLAGKELATILVPGDNSDSDSQIIFIEIETAKQKLAQEIKRESEEQLELQPPPVVTEMDIDLDKQDSLPAADHDLEEAMVEVLSEPPSLWSADDEAEEDSQGVPEREPASNTPTTNVKRRSSRLLSVQLGNSRQGMTLEETFAEIAAESSKQARVPEDSQDHEQKEVEEEQKEVEEEQEQKEEEQKEVEEEQEQKEEEQKEVEEEDEEDHVLIDLIEDSQSPQEIVSSDEDVALAKGLISKKLKVLLEAKDLMKLKAKIEKTELTEKANTTEEAKVADAKIEAELTVLMQEEPAMPVPETSASIQSEVNPDCILPAEEESVKPQPEAQPELPANADEADEVNDLPCASTNSEVSEATKETPLAVSVERKEEETSAFPTARMSTDQSDTQVEIQPSDKPARSSFDLDTPSMQSLAATKRAASREEPQMDMKKAKREGQAKKPISQKETKKDAPQPRERKKSMSERKKKDTDKKEKLPERISPPRESPAVKIKEKSPPEASSLKPKEKSLKISGSGGSKKETSPEIVGLPKKKDHHRQTPPEVLTKKDKESSRSPTEAVAPPDTTKTEAVGKKTPTSDIASKPKEKHIFFESDAMFKAMDKANAQLRFEEKWKKKCKKVVPPPAPPPMPMPKEESPTPAAAPTRAPIAPRKSLVRGIRYRRNTVYEDSPKLERSSSPSSDSTITRINTTPQSKSKRAKTRSKLNARRSTICEEGNVRAKANFSPLSTSSDSSSKHKPLTKLAKIKAKANPPPPTSSSSSSTSPTTSTTSITSSSSSSTKLRRRNTICEERQSSASPAIPLTKRRYSMHPKASADLLPDLNKKRAIEAGKVMPSRQDSLDSSSSASLGQLPNKKRRRNFAMESLLLLEIEESSQSSSSGSKIRRNRLPELEAPDPLKDIAKFIEDGVNLLKRDYKVAKEEAEVKQNEDEFAQRVANMETPDTTLSPSPTQSNPEEVSNGAGGVRRSHRIKQKPQGPKASQGRGVTSMALAPISMEEQLAELAHIEAINEQFLRNEGLNTFQSLRENYYRCARQVSQENAEMQCDCFLTGDEEAQGHLSCGAGCINRMLMIECGPLCTNRDLCTNKRFQQHKCWPCRVFRTEKKGCGITAELQVPPGEFLMEYVGEVIDSEEFERRQHLYSRDRSRHYYFMALRGEAVIDATMKGNISRFINHSCDPNAETQKWTVNGELRIGFFSLKTIQPGEEITFDYQYQRYGKDAQRCYCEAANCRGWIGGEPDSDEGEQLPEDSDSEADIDEDLELDEPGEDTGLPRKTVTKAKTQAKIKVKLPTAASIRKRKEHQVKNKDREYKAGRWLKPSAAPGSSSGEKAARKPKVSKFHAMLEDPDVLEELSVLSRSGLKNQLDTLRFSRCMVRAKLLQTRIHLLEVLTRGEMPCRRLFLDYHGLRLLHAWISENGNDLQLRKALLEALESLPIPNRTMLNESRVLQSVQLWVSSLQEQGKEDGGDIKAALHKRLEALLQKWMALPEIFRIPKRERIEQMKEHEREADRQLLQKHAMHATALEDQREQRESHSSSDRYRQDRFRRDTTSGRSSKPIRMSGNNTICTVTTQTKGSNITMDGAGGGGPVRNDNRRRSEGNTTEPRRILSKELRRSLFERKVALDEAEKRVCSDDLREHELRCEFFGADKKTDPKQLPFYQNTETGEWFSRENKLLPAPQRTELQAQAMLSPEEAEVGPAATAPAVEYKLPANVDPLPPSWDWKMTPDGDIYYYNLRDRISQWEPPSAEQRLQTLLKEDPATQQPLHELQNDPELLKKELIQVDMDYVGSLSSKSLTQYVEAKIKERRKLRRNRLVSVRVISPRRDEDRLYNQMESRKYKENKEKIRRRKEIYRRRRPDAVPAGSAAPEEGAAGNPLPIQGYLYSSDEDLTDIKAAPGAAPAAVAATPTATVVDKKVEELDALDMGPSTSHAALAALAKETLSSGGGSGGSSSKRKLPMPPYIPEIKKQRSENRAKKNKTPAPPANVREAHEKFRFDVSGLVAEILRPYRKESCRVGRICSDEDYKFLIKRLSQHITAKEIRYCDTSGHALSCSDSVRHKSYDFIHLYMRNKGRIYRKPADPTPI